MLRVRAFLLLVFFLGTTLAFANTELKPVLLGEEDHIELSPIHAEAYEDSSGKLTLNQVLAPEVTSLFNSDIKDCLLYTSPSPRDS